MDHAISPVTLRRRRLIRLGVALALLTGFGATAWGINRIVAPSLDAAEIMVAEVRRGDIANTISAAGVVIPVHEELVPSPISTRVAKVHAKPGEQVKAGQLLLELDDQSIRLAIESLKEQLAQQDNRIVALTQDMEQKRKQLTSSIELLQLDLQSASVKWERYQKLRQSGAVSGEDMLTAELNVKRNEIQLRQQRELIDDNRRATSTSVDGARLQQAILRKQIDQQQQLLAQAQVRAPFAGMLTYLQTEEGTSLAAGQLVAKVSELDNFQVEATLSDFHARSLTPGQQVRIEQGNQTLSGKVRTILPEIQNGSVKLIVALDQPNHPMLRNKLRVETSIVTEQSRATLLVQSGPAINGKGSQPVYLIRDGVARKTQVEFGASDGKAVQVLAGAALGDRLIISDTTRYKEHQQLRINK